MNPFDIWQENIRLPPYSVDFNKSEGYHKIAFKKALGRNTMKHTLLIVLLIGIIALMIGCGSSSETPADTATAEESTVQEETNGQDTSQPESDNGRVTAKTWYPIAEEASLAWQDDAVLTSVTGNNLSLSDEYPCDGRTNRWNYYFVSVNSRMSLDITVLNGKIDRQQDRELKHGRTPYTDEDLVWEMDLYPASEWQIDSDEAAQITADLFQEDRGKSCEGLITYVLFNSKDSSNTVNSQDWIKDLINDIHWVISTDSEGGPGSSFQVDINARTGEVKYQ